VESVGALPILMNDAGITLPIGFAGGLSHDSQGPTWANAAPYE
jgi:hypothetical protein